MNRIKHSIVFVAVLLAALAVDSCEFRTLERENAELMVSIYYKHDNPNKQKLIRAFNELMSQDIYEIVI